MYQMLRLFNRQSSVSFVEFVREHLLTEFKDAVDVFGITMVILQNI
jgi:hypothetical protein